MKKPKCLTQCHPCILESFKAKVSLVGFIWNNLNGLSIKIPKYPCQTFLRICNWKTNKLLKSINSPIGIKGLPGKEDLRAYLTQV